MRLINTPKRHQNQEQQVPNRNGMRKRVMSGLKQKLGKAKGNQNKTENGSQPPLSRLEAKAVKQRRAHLDSSARHALERRILKRAPTRPASAPQPQNANRLSGNKNGLSKMNAQNINKMNADEAFGLIAKTSDAITAMTGDILEAERRAADNLPEISDSDVDALILELDNEMKANETSSGGSNVDMRDDESVFSELSESQQTDDQATLKKLRKENPELDRLYVVQEMAQARLSELEKIENSDASSSIDQINDITKRMSNGTPTDPFSSSSIDKDLDELISSYES